MDIICRKCGEPWDMDELHYVDEAVALELRRSFDDVYASSRRVGCRVFGVTCNANVDARDTERAEICKLCGMLAFGRSGDDLDAAVLHEERYGHWPVTNRCAECGQPATTESIDGIAFCSSCATVPLYTDDD